MSRTTRAKRSLWLRFLAAIGWITIRIVKLGWRLLALTGSRLAHRKLQELEARRTSGAPSAV